MKDIKSRITVGILFVLVMTLGASFNYYTFAALFLLIVLLCVNEYHNVFDLQHITDKKLEDLNSKKIAQEKQIEKIEFIAASNKRKTTYRYINLIYSTIIFALFLLAAMGKIPLISIAIVVVFPLSWLIIQMHSTNDRKLINAAIISMGLFYLAVPISSACFIVFRESVFEFKYLLALLFFAWANDSFAYLFGNIFKKTALSQYKLWPQISPNKTWIGSFGGALGSLGFAYIAYIVLPLIDGSNIALHHYVALAVIASVMSTYGDLVESMIKRTLLIKDTGRALGGHGGFLDRFDGLIFAIPAAAIYVFVAGI